MNSQSYLDCRDEPVLLNRAVYYATAGDTLTLEAGEYTITEPSDASLGLDINKFISIIGAKVNVNARGRSDVGEGEINYDDGADPLESTITSVK